MMIIKTLKCFSLASVICISIAYCAFAEGLADCTNISTEKGKVTGVLDKDKGVCSYKGIPYAAPPVGELRFALSQEHSTWEKPLIADKVGNECIQFAMSLGASGNITGKEDCLYLNIWQPANTLSIGLKPVMIFIHGGGFIYGSGGLDLYYGDKLTSAQDVIVVTLNYRLGPFGFLVHPAFRNEDGKILSNYGLYDQLAAFKWVKNNIKNFGGDSENITIFGESAGGMSVGLHLASPLSKGLFQKAIVQSGPVVLAGASVEDAAKTAPKISEKLGCTDNDKIVECMRSISANEILSKTQPKLHLFEDSEISEGFAFGPIIDGAFIPENPLKLFKEGNYQKDVKVMLGTNRDEASYFILSKTLTKPEHFTAEVEKLISAIKKTWGISVDKDKAVSLYPLSSYKNPRLAYSDLFTDTAFTCTTRLMADALANNGSKPYLYYFTKAPIEKGFGKDWGVYHGAELHFIFGEFSFMTVKFSSSANSALSKKVMSLWGSFAKTGIPKAEGIPEWAPYDFEHQAFLTIDIESRLEEKLKIDKCNFIGGIIEKALLE